jgi:hypothetical protein
MTDWLVKHSSVEADHEYMLSAVGRKGTGMSFGIYIVGFLILIGGLIYGAVILHVATHWIAVGAIVLLGLAILKGVQATRGKDPSQ